MMTPPSPFFLFFFFLLSSLICCLSLHRDSQAGPCRAACYTYCPAGIHCSQLVCRHVFDSTRTCVRTNQLAHFCKRAGVSGCKCLQKHFFFFFFWGAGKRPQNNKKKHLKKKHEKTQVRTSLITIIIYNNPSICSAGPGAGSAEKHGKKKNTKKCQSRKKVMRFLRGGREKSVFTIPLFGLANFLLAVGSTEMRAC